MSVYSVKEIFHTLQGEGANAGRAAVFCRFAGCNLWSGREQDRATAVCRFCDTDFMGTDGTGGGKFAGAGELAERLVQMWQGEAEATQSKPNALAARPLIRPQSLAPPRRAGHLLPKERRNPYFSSPSPLGVRGPQTDATIELNQPAGADLHRFVVFTGGEPLLQLDTALIAATHAAGFTIAVETNGTLSAPSGIDWICVSPKAGAALVQRSGQELKLVYPQVGLAPADVEGLDFENFFLQPMDGPRRAENTYAVVQYCLAHPKWRLSLQTHKIIGIR